jgi:lupus La protein
MTSAESNKDKIVKQVEFYFSDVNIAKDTFLKSKMAESAEGFVSIGTLLTFKRLAALVEGADHKEAAVADALADSASLIVDKAALAVRRREALPESITVEESTLYAKPVPPTATLEELQAYFAQHGPVRAIWRRPVPGAKTTDGASKQFKDSVFVVFDSPETVLRVCAAPPKVINGEELMTVMPKTAYLESKGGAKKASAGAAAVAKESQIRTPPMPANASATITGVGKFIGFKAVKGLWSADLQSGIRYVSLSNDNEIATIIFQDAETADRMLKDMMEKAPTVNGMTPDVTRLNETQDKIATEFAEREIKERAVNKFETNRGGRGGGRGGRGGGRGGRGGGRGAKRSRD